MIKTQVYVHLRLYENSIGGKQKYIRLSDANLESFSYRTWQWSCTTVGIEFGTIFEVA